MLKMYCLKLCIILSCVTTSVLCRPSPKDSNSDLDETEYDYGAAADDSNPEDGDTRVDEDSNDDQEESKYISSMRENSQQRSNENVRHFEANLNSYSGPPSLQSRDVGSYEKHRQDTLREGQFNCKRHNLNEEKELVALNVPEKTEYENVKKLRTISGAQSVVDEAIKKHNELLFDGNNKEQNKMRNYLTDESQESEDMNKRNGEHFYELQSNYENSPKNQYDYYNRNTRSANEDNLTGLSNNNQMMNSETKDGDEREIIKEHIKKLNSEELQELLQSLSGDRRELLQSIIDDSNATDGLTKREIPDLKFTVTEVNNSEGQPEPNKAQDSTTADDINIDNVGQTTESNEAAKKKNDENNKFSSSTINTLPESKAPVSTSSDSIKDYTFSNALSTVSDISGSNDLPTMNSGIKNNAKRESVDDNAQDDSSFYAESGNINEFSELLEADIDSPKSNLMKRELEDNAIYASMKSLEDSFPNPNKYQNSLSYSEPLIRVKRKDQDEITEKKAAYNVPDTKTSYFSYNNENHDENEEGNEFNDDGFYERMSGSEKREISHDNLAALNEDKENVHDEIESGINVQKHIDSLGSDSDAVVSGVEKADENLMYNVNSRNRRQAYLKENPDLLIQPLHDVLNNDNQIESTSAEFVDSPSYQENDAFGPLPNSNVGDLGRYKRIRRVKQSHRET